MSATDAIWAALDTHLAGTAGVPPIFYENGPVKAPEQGTSFLEVQFLPTSRRPSVVGADPQKRYQGIYEIRACTPLHIGTGAARQLAALLEERFDGHDRISGVDVVVNIEYSETRQGFRREPFYCIPVLVGWYAHAQ